MDTGRLESRIATLRNRVRRLLALNGLGWVVGLSVPLVLLACLADWLLHLDSIARLTALVALTMFIAWVVFHTVITPLVVRFADLDIAMRIEERWPGLNDQLVSTVQFLKLAKDDDRHGSRALREATVRQTLEETRSIDFRQVVQKKPLWRSLGLAALSVASAGGLIASEPALAGIAARRLFLPFGPDRWPQMTHISLLEKETTLKIARGESFTLGVAVSEGESAPSSAKATYAFDDGETVYETLRSVEGGVFRGRIESVEKSFQFSVAAGDDSSSVVDIPVKVVPPPVIDSLSIRLVPPDYTKLPPQVLSGEKTQVKALEGTKVVLSATANKPIEVATLRLGEKLGGPAVSLDKGRTKLTAEFRLKESSPFWFDLIDTEGFRNRDATRYDLRANRDEPPRVTVDDPNNDRDVSAKAVVPVAFTVDDDFGIQSARLVYKAATGGSEPVQEVVLPLWDSSGDAAVADDVPVKHKVVKYAWDLAPLKLPPGSVITFHADARDFDSIKGPNLGKSREIRLRIVTDDEMARQFDEARRVIREDVEAILNMQNQARTPVDEALRTLKTTDKLDKATRENLKNAGMIQRQVANRVTNKADGLDQKVARFLDDLKNSKIPNPDAQKQMEGMRDAVARVRDNRLEPAEQGLTRAAKNLGDPDMADQAPDSKDANADPVKRTPSNKGRDAGKNATNKDQGDRQKADTARGENRPEVQAKGRTDATETRPQPEGSKPVESAPAEVGRKPGDAAKESLAEASGNQKAIAEELQNMLDGLSQFETVRVVAKEAKELLNKHEQAMKQTAEAAGKPELTGKTPDQLSPEQKAELANLAARQSAVAKGLQGVQEKMKQMAERLKESDPMAAEAMRDAAEQSAKAQTGGKIGEAAEQLEKNQMGAARSSQEQARDDLKELVDAIENRRERELSKLVKELKQAEAELKKLKERQTQNLNKTRQAKAEADPKARAEQLKKLAKEQADLKAQAESQLKKLAKLNAEAAAKAAAKAAGKMAKASKISIKIRADQAEQDEDEALADLEEAEKETKEARKEAEEQLAMEQLSKMGDQLKSLAERQEKMVIEIAGYDKVRTGPDKKISPAQRSGIRNLAAVQDAIKDETAELTEKLEGAPVFALTLRRATEGMDNAAQRLQSLKTDELTQRAASAAAARFKQLIESLKPDKPKNGGQQQGGNPGEGEPGPQAGGGDGIPPAAQIKMLKSLQQEINERTEFFDELGRRKKDLNNDQTAELNRLHQDQGTLADLVRDLTRPKKSDAED